MREAAGPPLPAGGHVASQEAYQPPRPPPNPGRSPSPPPSAAAQPLTEKLGDDLGAAPQGDTLLVPAELLGHGGCAAATAAFPRRPVQTEPRPRHNAPFPPRQPVAAHAR